MNAAARLSLPRAGWAIVVVLLVAAPYGVGVLTLKSIADVAILAVVVMSCNVLTGVTGQISLAQGAFMGIAAYATCMLVSNLGWTYWAALPVAIAVAGAVGLLVGLPALRIMGLHLALVTLGVALVFPTFVLKLGDPAGGPNGIALDRTLEAPSWFWANAVVWDYWVVVAVLLLVLLVCRNVLTSRVGRALVTIKEQPILAAAMGTDVRRVKVATFGATAALAGLAGWLFAVHHRFVSPTDFGVFLSLNILLAMTLGGSGSIAGPLLGAAFLRFSPDMATAVGLEPILAPALTGFVVIVLLYFLPGGVASLGHRLRDVWVSTSHRRGRVSAGA